MPSPNHIRFSEWRVTTVSIFSAYVPEPGLRRLDSLINLVSDSFWVPLLSCGLDYLFVGTLLERACCRLSNLPVHPCETKCL